MSVWGRAPSPIRSRALTMISGCLLRLIQTDGSTTTLVEDENSYSTDGEAKHRNGTKGGYAHIVEIGECVPARILWVVKHDYLFAHREFVGFGTLTPCVGFPANLKLIDVLIMISRFMRGNQSRGRMLALR